MEVFPDAEISDEIIPAATLSYFFTPNLAVELFCCFANHTVDLPAPGATGEVTDLWIFPPALTLQYHFTGLGPTKPYVGVGAQYIHFFDESVGVAAAGLGVTSVDVDDAWGVTLQAGLDHDIGNGWFLNFDVKKTFLETDVKLRTAGGTLSYDLDLDPWIVSGGIGYRFNLFNRGTVHHTLK